jgi:hypothetical protein
MYLYLNLIKELISLLLLFYMKKNICFIFSFLLLVILPISLKAQITNGNVNYELRADQYCQNTDNDALSSDDNEVRLGLLSDANTGGTATWANTGTGCTGNNEVYWWQADAPSNSGTNLNWLLYTGINRSGTATTFRIEGESWEEDGSWDCSGSGDAGRWIGYYDVTYISAAKTPASWWGPDDVANAEWVSEDWTVTSGSRNGDARIKTVWRYTNGTACASPLTFGTLTSGTTYTNSNSNRSAPTGTSNAANFGYSNVLGNTANDVFYSFTLSAPATVTISTDNAGTDYDTNLRLYNSNCGTQITSNDDVSYPTNTKSTISGQVLCAGTYTIMVEGFSTNTGNFNLSVVATNLSALAGGTIAGITNPTDICLGGDPGAFTSTAAASGGNSASYTYQWERAPTNAFASITNVGTNSTTYDPDASLTVGTYYFRRKVTDACSQVAYSNIIQVNVVADPVAQTITPSVANGSTLCVGGTVSATFSGGSGGAGTITDTYEYTTNGGTNWNTYTSGSAITATAAMLGTNTIQIRTRRTATGTGCDNSSYNTVSFSVNQINWANLQSPASGSICASGTFDVYGQIYEPSVTEAAGAGAGIIAQLGYSTTNTDPSTWTNWGATTFNTQSGNNDEYKGTLSGLTAGTTYYYTFRYSLNGCGWQYGGYNGGFWNGTTNVNGTLTVFGITITSGAVGGSASLTQCIGGNPAAFAVGTPTGGNGSYTYQWEQSAGCTGTWTNATAEDGITNTLNFNPPILNSLGTMCYRLKITDGCGSVSYSATKTYTVVADPISQTVTPSVANGSTLCVGGTVSATFSGGSGGTGVVTDVYEYTTNSGGLWSTYTPGTNITATTGMLGTNTIQIRTRRTASGTGCDNGAYNTVTYSVNQLDWANLQYPGTASICQGGSFTAFGQVHEPGVTPGAGAQGAGIEAQFGYHTANTNPSTWTNWFNASFNAGGGGVNNDEYQYTISGLTPNTYYYTFRYRINGCGWQYGGYVLNAGGFWDGTTNISGVLTVNSPPSAGITNNTGSTILTCSRTSISLTATGGSTYAWSNGLGSSANANVTAPNTYTVTVTDTNSCTATASITITQDIATPSLTTSMTHVLCNGNTTGAINLTVTGTSTPYTYLWSNGASTEDISSLAAGAYTVTVTGANGCTASTSVTITQPAALVGGTCNKIDDFCHSGTGAIDVKASGGVAPYTVTWTPTHGSPSSPATISSDGGVITITALQANTTYTFTIKDSNNCQTP